MRKTSRVGVTGHLNLTPPTVELVRADLRQLLRPPLVGVTCLARGADTVFAEVVLAVGGALEVVLPCEGYGDTMVRPEHRPRFEALLEAAATVRVMPFRRPGRQAYEAANRHILHTCDLLIAVWDGQRTGHRGGTGAFVAEARAAGLPVDVRWPAGAAREST
ncbi:hypothetical protein Daura_04020 [Dactylosporangium aurantiacum]|uniref:DUF1273 domain-containing protein n=1 Tax=Dactylosporangium aurantiacum TaxID=35754 RepID=A0A9Q9MGC4_9ACTN|nr:hypothetical protein [Dactylosporangium aurantiacum]MDG6110240.1 hypothetical protein [Dactylosporangium aurantiacum]UWZ55419.1 hypothetical protein Daura_04020 [Dactylosporangium aurantiacum]